jgi:predicted PurR-regulated permease PerM
VALRIREEVRDVSTSSSADDQAFLRRSVEAAIRIGLLILLIGWCFQIVRPFIEPIVWAIIIAVATHPTYRRIERALGGRRGLAAALFTLGVFALLVAPATMLTGTLIDGAQSLSHELRDGELVIPPPPESVGSWPFVGEWIERFWSNASKNIEAAFRMIEPQLKTVGGWLLSKGAATGMGLLKFVISIFIAGFLHANAAAAQEATRAISTRLAGERGADFAELAVATVHSVARGILGVALLQALLAGMGMLAVGVPAAGLWSLLVLLLAVVQLPPLLVLGPIILYVFYTSSTVAAILFMIWSLLVGVCDSFLKPLFLGRGVEVPMLVIFIGAIGGFIFQGIVGLFVGAVVLAVSYNLFNAWIAEDAPAPESAARAETG